MRQAALHMIRHPYRFYPYIEQELLETGESYESYCYNVYHCNVWGDDLIASVIGDMWNLGITILSPMHKKPLHLFHNKIKNPDVVIVANGGSYLAQDKGSTHFNATRPFRADYRKPGAEFLHPTISINMNQKLQPIILSDKDKAHQISLNEYLKCDTERSLTLLRGVMDQLNRVDDRIAELIKESDDMRSQKDILVHKLSQLGVSVDRIKEVTDLLKERPYCRTGEREKIDEELEKKRKAEEEAEEKEAKKQKVVPTVEGEIDPDYEIKTPEKLDEEYNAKLKRQQKDLIRQQEILLQAQEQQLIKQQQTITFQQQMLSQQQPTVTVTPRVDLPGISTGGAGTIDNFLSPEALAFLKGGQNPAISPRAQKVIVNQDTGGQQIIVSQTSQEKEIKTIQTEKGGKRNVLIPKLVENQNIILIPAAAKKSTPLRSSELGPVPENRQDPRRHYCDKCYASYTTKDELTRHKTYNCLKPIPQFICEACDKSYFWQSTLREHYYKEHVGVIMYHCTKCNQPFHWNNRVSKHRNACPNKDGPDLYKGRIDLDPALEEKFKRRVAIDVDIPEEVRTIAEEELEKEQAGSSSLGLSGQIPEENVAKQVPPCPQSTTTQQVTPIIPVTTPSTSEDQTAASMLQQLSEGGVIPLGTDDVVDDNDDEGDV